MKTIWKIFKQRYKDMGNLLFAVLVGMISVMMYFGPTIVRLLLAGTSERMLGGVYACNLLVILVFCFCIIRIDCRKLISNKTAGILESIGSFTVLFMLIRNSFAKRAGDLGDEFLYSLDWFTIMLFGIMMAFIGKIVRRAEKIKEENDLTI